MAKVTYKEYPIETVTYDGTILKGKIYYWAKGYRVCLTEPIEGEKPGEHLMHMIPAKFIVDESKADGVSVEGNISLVNIYHKAIKMIQKIYTDHRLNQL